MVTTKDLKQVEDLDGVANYLLVRRDGAVVSKNIEDAVTLASTVVLSGTSCEAMEKNMGGKRYRYMAIERESGEHLLIFSLGNYFLGIIQQSGHDIQKLNDTIIAFLKKLFTKGKNHPGIGE